MRLHDSDSLVDCAQLKALADALTAYADLSAMSASERLHDQVMAALESTTRTFEEFGHRIRALESLTPAPACPSCGEQMEFLDAED